MITQRTQDNVDLSAVNEELQLLSTKISAMDQVAIPDRAPGRSRSAELAEVTRNLLYLQHLCKRLENAIMDEYWHARGHDDHFREA